MAKAFIFKKPQLTILDKTTMVSTVVGDENFAPDGITLTIESDAREIERFNGTDRFASGSFTISGTIATILEGQDIWQLFSVFKISGIETSVLSNGMTGIAIGDVDCVTDPDIEVTIEDSCRDEADVQKRIKLTAVEFNAESIELALNNADGITPEIAFYANADDDGIKAYLGFDDASS